MKKAIVTGATGFIGGWLVQELIKNNVFVTVIVRSRDRLLAELAGNPAVCVVEGNLERIQPAMLNSREFDAFYHLGWGGVAPEDKNNIQVQLGNIQMSLAALELAHAVGCRKFIAAGTVAEYVFCDGVMDVNGRHTPNDMYGAAKASTQYFLEVKARQIGQPFVWMVIPSTFGERRMDNNIITYTVKSLLAGERPVYGNLEQMWDFLYVGEVVRAMRLIGEKGISGKTYGIGSGHYRPLRKYIEEIRDMIDPELELGIGERQKQNGQTLSSCVNIYELTADTGFVPQVSFKEGIYRMIEVCKAERIIYRKYL